MEDSSISNKLVSLSCKTLSIKLSCRNVKPMYPSIKVRVKDQTYSKLERQYFKIGSIMAGEGQVG